MIVADNDSTDGTALLARNRGCRVAHVEKRRIAILVFPLWLLLAPKRLGTHIQRYWYEDER